MGRRIAGCRPYTRSDGSGARGARPREALRLGAGARGRGPRGRTRRARRTARPQRRGQVDARQDRLRADPVVTGARRGLRCPGRLGACAAVARLPRGALPLPRLVLGGRGPAAAPASRRVLRRRGGAARAPGPRRPRQRPRDAGRRDVEGNAAAARDRPGARRVAARPLAGRADERARSRPPADDGGAARGAARPRGVEIETDEGTRLIADASRDDVPALVERLVADGRRVYGVRVVATTLEEEYLEAVGGGTAVGGGRSSRRT